MVANASEKPFTMLYHVEDFRVRRPNCRVERFKVLHGLQKREYPEKIRLKQWATQAPIEPHALDRNNVKVSRSQYTFAFDQPRRLIDECSMQSPLDIHSIRQGPLPVLSPRREPL